MVAITRRIGGNTQSSSRTRIVSPVIPDTSYTRSYNKLLKQAQDSKQLQDIFAKYRMYGVPTGKSGFRIIEPVYSPDKLIQLYLESSVLRPIVESYVTNIEAYGHVLEYTGPEGEESSVPAQQEKAALEYFLNAPSAETCSMIEIRRLARTDKEVIGYSTYEIIRDGKGRVVGMNHAPAASIRMTTVDPDPVEVTVLVFDSYTKGFSRKKLTRRFRRFVQVTGAMTKVFFKEFGDPRKISSLTGQADPSISPEEEATEILYDARYAPGSVYGIPLWVGNIPSILGSRESEVVNLNFFRDNAIPALAVLVSGGALTEESFTAIEQYIIALRGQRAMNRVLVLEASADDSGSVDHSNPSPKVDLKPMVSERQQEGLFQEYDKNNMSKVRASMRLPPVLTGLSQDYTRATAFASLQMAENQIFVPERQAFDEIMNKRILATYAPKFWSFRSLGPPVSDPESVAGAVAAFGGEGALTPNIVIRIANRILDARIEPVLEPWGDYPFAILMEYAKSGKELKGITEFLVDLDAATDEPDPDESAELTDPTEPAVDEPSTSDAVGDYVKEQLRTMVKDFLTVNELQTFAEEPSDAAN